MKLGEIALYFEIKKNICIKLDPFFLKACHFLLNSQMYLKNLWYEVRIMRCLVAIDKCIKGEYLKVNCKGWEAKQSTENRSLIWKCGNYNILKAEEIACN